MAHLLTLGWLLLWFGAQLLWLRSGRRKSRPYVRAYWRTALLVSCLSILLFPVVSSDDDAAWAQQIQIDFEAVGATQTTRSGSRYDLPAELIVPDAVQLFIIPPILSRLHWPMAHEAAPAAVPIHFRSVAILRGPPSLQF